MEPTVLEEKGGAGEKIKLEEKFILSIFKGFIENKIGWYNRSGWEISVDEEWSKFCEGGISFPTIPLSEDSDSLEI